MLNIFNIVIAFVIAAIVLATQYFLGGRKQVSLGAILPAIFLGFTIWLFVSGKIQLTFGALLPFIIFEVILFSIWEEAHKKFKEKNLSELEKMKKMDL